MRNPTFQLITGSVLVLLNVVAVLAGLCVIGHCLPRIAEGRMTASLPILGEWGIHLTQVTTTYCGWPLAAPGKACR